MPTVCVIQHAVCETPGLIADVLQQEGVARELVRPYRGDPVPDRIGRYACLVVLGGPMGVYEQDRYPFLAQELRLIESAVKAQRPVLGVCLGSQLLAAALGAPVTRGFQKEIGWHPVTLSKAAADDALLHGAPASFTPLHWHGDVFELPRGAVSLGWSKLTECQAFRYGPSAYGFLFHLEATAETVRRMAKKFRHELGEVGVCERELLEPIKEHLPALQPVGTRVFERWSRLVTQESPLAPNAAKLRLKRVYDPPALDDGARFLVDRLWPRGQRKETLQLDGWLKDVAPSHALCGWFDHDPAKWLEFRRRYFAELAARAETLSPILQAAQHGNVALLFSARDAEHNNAVALADYLQSQLGRESFGERRGDRSRRRS